MFSGDFMRPEVWHALSVHFPIALLPVATITLMISFFVQEPRRRSWQTGATLLLFAGTAMAWVAVYTGNTADGIVSRKICDPTVLKDHELAGETMTYLFTSAAVLSGLVLGNVFMTRLRALGFYLAFGLMLVGTAYLTYAGHVGATLVYEQGAGVKDHNQDCDEYE